MLTCHPGWRESAHRQARSIYRRAWGTRWSRGFPAFSDWSSGSLPHPRRLFGVADARPRVGGEHLECVKILFDKTRGRLARAEVDHADEFVPEDDRNDHRGRNIRDARWRSGGQFSSGRFQQEGADGRHPTRTPSPIARLRPSSAVRSSVRSGTDFELHAFLSNSIKTPVRSRTSPTHILVMQSKIPGDRLPLHDGADVEKARRADMLRLDRSSISSRPRRWIVKIRRCSRARKPAERRISSEYAANGRTGLRPRPRELPHVHR